MSILDLLNSIKQHLANGIAQIPTSSFFSSTVVNFANQYFPNNQVLLENAQITNTSQSVSINGSMRLFSNNLYPTKFEIILDSSGDPQFKLETTLPAAWSFKESFPLLNQGIFNELKFSEASFAIISDPSVFASSLSAGLNFQGTISGGLPSPLGAIWSGDLDVAGSILIEENIPQLTLNLKTNKAFSFDGFSLSNVACQLCTLPVQNVSYSGNQMNFVTNPNSINDFIRFSSSIEIDSHTIDVSGSYSFVTESLILDATNLQLNLADGLSGLFKLIGYTPTITWPAANFVLNDILLSNVSFLVDFQSSTPTLQSFGFGVTVDTNWSFIPNKVELENIKVAVWMSAPLEAASRQYGGAISGTFKLGDTTGIDLDITARMPSSSDPSQWEFSGYTFANQQLPIGHLVSDLADKFGAISVPSFIDNLTIEDLNVSFDTSKNFTFACKGSLPIAGQNITTAFNIAFTDSDDGASSLAFTGSMWINENYFSINFDHTGASGDQSASTVFSATWSDDGSGLTIQEIIEFFGLSLDIPSELDLALSSVAIKYDTAKELFLLEVKTSNYGSLVLLSFHDQKTSKRECFMGLELGTSVQLPALSNALNQLPSASKSNVGSFHLLLCSSGISDNQLITKLNTAIGTGYPQIPPKGLKGELVNVQLNFTASDSLVDTFTKLGITEASIFSSLPVTLKSIGFLIEENENQFTAALHIQTSEGIKLDSLLDLGGDLPASLNPELDAIDFVLQYQSGEKSSSTSFAFSTSFTDDNEDFVFVGAFEKSSGASPSTIFGGNIYSPSKAGINMGDSFPINLSIQNLFLAKVTTGGSKPSSFTLFGSDLTIDADFNLSTLPVVGSFLTEAKFSFNALRFTYLKPKAARSTPDGISADELTLVNTFLQEINVAPLVTSQSNVSTTNGKKANFPSGYSLQGSLILGDHAMTIPLHTNFVSEAKSEGSKGKGSIINMSKDSGSTSASPGKSPSTASPVGKKFGPVVINSVGLGMRDGGLGLKFTGGLHIGPVTFDLIGFEITSPITHFDPDITIQGLGLDIKKGALSLEGLFMEENIEIPEIDYSTGEVTTETLKAYEGALSIQYKQYTLDALGSYAQLPSGDPTMFLYAFLGTPLGGPPVFFVTGVAAGFGYNRTFNLPQPTEISTFPLIQPVMGTPPKGDLAANFSNMNKAFLPQKGAFWGAVGVRGETFKMVDSFVLLDVQLNEEIEIDLLGISNMTFPTPKEGDSTHPLAKVIIGVEARILPQQGVVVVKGAFQPGTFILDPSAHIQGGFGMLSIFAEQTSGTWYGAKEGTFVFSLGGYPNHYKTPDYYPQPQRLELNWQVNPVQTIKGSAYFAITPEAMMAGGSLENLYNIGGPLDISASFILGADFMIYWKPYHYTAGLSLEIDVSAYINVDLWLFTVHVDFNMDLGADLQIWGPPFAGKGVLHVHFLVSFSVDVSFGDANRAPKPIEWSEFSTSFLPDSDKILNAVVSSGLLYKVEQKQSNKTTSIDVVNLKEMSLVCHTAFPLKRVETSTQLAVKGTSTTDFGVAPMAKTSSDLTSSLTVSITKHNSTTNVEGDFTYEIITRNLPSAMWEAAEKEGTIPDTQGKHLIRGLACGVEIKPKPQAPKTPFTITEPEKEIIQMPPTEEVASFTYDASSFTLTA